MTRDFVPFQMHFPNTFTLFAICIPSVVTGIIDFLECVGVVGVCIDLIWFELNLLWYLFEEEFLTWIENNGKNASVFFTSQTYLYGWMAWASDHWLYVKTQIGILSAVIL